MLANREYRYFVSQPVVLTAIGITFINDHILKYSAVSGFVTGKLSDFFGLFFFPFLIYDIFSIMFSSFLDKNSNRVFISLLCVSGGIFSSIKLFPSFNQLVTTAAAICLPFKIAIVTDATDLFALVVLPYALRYFKKTAYIRE